MSDKRKPSVVEQPDSPLCPTCKTTSKRSLVVCIDGTSNQFSIRNTNVVELYSRLIKDGDQRTFYNSGIGTYAKPHGLTFRQWIANKRDLAFAWQFDKVLLSAYRWLSENHEPGDRIFLFGFSRGAYQVRALSAMIRDVGLIHKGNQDQIPFAYQLYADPNSRVVSSTPLSTGESVKSYLYHKAGKKYTPKTGSSRSNVDPPKTGSNVDPPETGSTLDPPETGSTLDPPKTGSNVDPPKTGSTVDLAARFKTTFSRKDVKVHFIGVWDTVSSVGLVYGKTLPGTTDGMEHACFFRHALAIHERRVKFLPEFADTSNKTGGGSNAANTTEGNRSSGGAAGAQQNPTSDVLQGSKASRLSALPGDNTLKTPKKDIILVAQEPRIKEVWFAGSHSDIGGGNVPNAGLDLFGPSLRWMSFESMLAGLKLGDDPRKWENDPKKFIPYKSLKGMWWILEILPVKQLSFLHSSKRDKTVRRPHLGRWRRAFAEEEVQRLHETALEVIGLDCLPAKAKNHLLEKRKRDAEAKSAKEPPQGAPTPPLLSGRAYGPDLTLWPDLDVESDPYHDALSFLQLLHTRGLSRASDVDRLEELLANGEISAIITKSAHPIVVSSGKEAGRNSIRDAIQKLIDEEVEVLINADRNHKRGDSVSDYEMRLKVKKSRGKVLSEWGSTLLPILEEWDKKRITGTGALGAGVGAGADPHPDPAACTRTLSALFRLFACVEARLSFPQSRDLRRLAKSFATRGSEGSEEFLLLVNSVMPAALTFPLRGVFDSAVISDRDGIRAIVGSTGANDCLVLDYSERFPPLSPPRHLFTDARIQELAVSGDGAFIGVALTSPQETVLTIWEAASPGDKPAHTVESLPAQAICLAFNHDGTRLVAGCRNGAIIVWTRADGPVWSQLASFPDDPMWSISWSRDYVAAGSRGGFLSVWDMGTASTPTELLPRTDVGSCVRCLAFDPMTTSDRSHIRLVTAGCDSFGTVQLGVVEGGVYRLNCHLKMEDDMRLIFPLCVSFSPDGKHIAAGMIAGKVRIWDADSYQPVCDGIDIPGGFDVLALSFEPNDTVVKAVCGDGLVRLLCWK